MVWCFVIYVRSRCRRIHRRRQRARGGGRRKKEREMGKFIFVCYFRLCLRIGPHVIYRCVPRARVYVD